MKLEPEAGGTRLQAKERQGHQELGEAREDPPQEPWEEDSPKFLDFGLLVSRTLKEQILFILSGPICGDLLQQSQEIHILPFLLVDPRLSEVAQGQVDFPIPLWTCRRPIEIGHLPGYLRPSHLSNKGNFYSGLCDAGESLAG